MQNSGSILDELREYPYSNLGRSDNTGRIDRSGHCTAIDTSLTGLEDYDEHAWEHGPHHSGMLSFEYGRHSCRAYLMSPRSLSFPSSNFSQCSCARESDKKVCSFYLVSHLVLHEFLDGFNLDFDLVQ
jgi:hypothetical protein